MGYESALPKLSPMDEDLFGLNSNPLVRAGMSLSQVSDLVIYEEDLLDASITEPDAIIVWRAASQLVDSGRYVLTLEGVGLAIATCHLARKVTQSSSILETFADSCSKVSGLPVTRTLATSIG